MIGKFPRNLRHMIDLGFLICWPCTKQRNRLVVLLENDRYAGVSNLMIVTFCVLFIILHVCRSVQSDESDKFFPRQHARLMFLAHFSLLWFLILCGKTGRILLNPRSQEVVTSCVVALHNPNFDRIHLLLTLFSHWECQLPSGKMPCFRKNHKGSQRQKYYIAQDSSGSCRVWRDECSKWSRLHIFRGLLYHLQLILRTSYMIQND